MKLGIVAALCLALVLTPQPAFAVSAADEARVTGSSLQVPAAATNAAPVTLPPVAAVPQPRALTGISGGQQLIGMIEGIPRHHIVIPSFPEREVDIV
ncbi:MAG: hypothetical protein V3V67_00090, partial [Myxococcota bacterium]